MVEPKKIPERQLDLGSASYFKVTPELIPGNQVLVSTGFVYAGGYSISDGFTGGPQTSPAFSPVSPATQRYDLVFLDETATVGLLAGTAVAFGSPAFNGGPGFNLGPDLPDNAVPVAYVFVNEIGSVVVNSDDITVLGGQFHAGRELDGYITDKGAFGSAPAGLTDDVSALFAGSIPGGTASQRGCVTVAPLNYVTLVDQASDEVLHSTGARMYGRLTWAASVWSLAYHYIDAAGAEQTMDPSSDTAGLAPTDIILVGVPCVFSRNDPARPLFQSGVQRLSDQVVGTVPDGTETSKGIVEFAPNGGTAALEAVQGNDSRLAGAGAVSGRANAGPVLGPEPIVRVIAGSGITVGLVVGGGELQFTIGASGGGLTNQVSSTSWSGTVGNIAFNPAFTNHPNLAIILNRDGGQGFSVGCCIGTGGIVAQGCAVLDGIGATEEGAYVEGSVIAYPNSPFNQFLYTIGSFTGLSITMNRSGADLATTITGRMFVLGQ